MSAVPNELYETRKWLQEAIKAKGGEITGCGVSMVTREADISFTLNGAHYWIDLRPSFSDEDDEADAA